ncbi:hypothetical protein I33_2476 [Bacillus subtilis subsp. subtilis str. RO-NN-1]|nr:hypothetical protein I33_2476 [Bacillus subtilis subsp. subtilis str. RO-NN-1]
MVYLNIYSLICILNSFLFLCNTIFKNYLQAYLSSDLF